MRSILFISLSFLFSVSQAQPPAPAPEPSPKDQAVVPKPPGEEVKSDQAVTSEPPVDPPTNSLSDPQGVQHHLIRQLVVFPMQVDPSLQEAAEKAWWKVREELTEGRRFLIASKQFMTRKDVFHPRTAISPADAVLLGKHLEADGLILLTLEDRTLNLRAFSGQTGILLYDKGIRLSQNVPLKEQLEPSSKKLVDDFLATTPYQGFTLLDPLMNKVVFDEGKKQMAKVDAGTKTAIGKGDPVQWLAIKEAPPVYQDNRNFVVVAEGVVNDIQNGVIIVEVKRYKNMDYIQERSLVRFPKEAQRLSENDLLPNSRNGLTTEIVIAEMRAAQTEADQHKPLVATGMSLGTMLALLLLAF